MIRGITKFITFPNTQEVNKKKIKNKKRYQATLCYLYINYINKNRGLNILRITQAVYEITRLKFFSFFLGLAKLFFGNTGALAPCRLILSSFFLDS